MNKMIKKIAVFGLAVAFIGFAAFKLTGDNEQLELGEGSSALASPVFTVDGEENTLRGMMGQNGLLVVFSCNTCPFVVAWEDRYNELNAYAKENNIGMVLVNSNEKLRAEEDSPENMKKHAEELGYTMPYVIDKNHMIADAFGAKTTPHVFLFNNKLRLAYKGSIDDNFKDKEAVKETYLKDAMSQMIAGEEVSNPVTEARGCSIKRLK